MMKNNYYPRIRELREDYDMTQQALAERVFLKRQQYARYEQGQNALPTDILVQLAQIFGVSADYILGLTDERTPYPKSKIKT